MRKTILIVCLVLSIAQLFANKKFLPPPTIQSSNIAVERDGTALHFTWTNGNGARRIVVMRQGAAVTSTPVNGIDYNFNQNFGSGDQLNPGEYVVSDGSSNTLTVINLQPGTTYHIAIFEYNGTGAATDYLVAGAPAFSATTYAGAPTVQATNVVFSNVGFNTMTVSWTPGNGSGAMVIMRANNAVNGTPVDLTLYASNPNFGSGFQVGAGNYAVYQGRIGFPNSVTVTNLQPGITYHVAVFEINGLFGTFFNTVNPARGSQATVSRPTNPASNITFNGIDGDRVRLNWTNGNGTRRIVVARAGSDVTSTPSDGIDYSSDPNFSLASELAAGDKIVFDGNANTTEVTGLQPSTTYHFRIYEYLGTGTGIQYLTSSFGSGSQSTLLPPTTQSSNIVFSNVTGTQFEMSWTRGNGAQRIILMKAGAPVDADPANLQVYLPNSNFGQGDEIGNGNFVVQRGIDFSYRVFGAQPGITYHLAIYEFNGTTGPVYNLVNPARASILIPAAPTVAPLFGFADALQGNSMRLNWSAGNGQRRLIIASAESPVTAVPADGVDYAANTDFTLAQEISPGQRVVYDGTGGSEFITGLQPATTYHFRIYEFNIANGIPFYYTAAFGQGTGTTRAGPTSAPTNMIFSNPTSTSIDVNWTNGNGNGRVLIVHERSPVTAEPTDFTTYTANAAFGLGDQVGVENYVVYNGSPSGVTVSNLQPGTTYYFALHEYNNVSNPIYLRPGLLGNFTMGGPPQFPATSVTVNTVTSNSMTITWTNGGGNGRLVLMSEGAPVSSIPVNNVEYTGNAVFGTGSELRTLAGNFAVYNGIGSTVTVTGLRARTNYHFTVFEYNRFNPGDIQYLTSSSASGSSLTDAPLPVTLLSFNAELKNEQVKLDWSTAQETNSSHFIIEKSSNGVQFVNAGEVQAAGNSAVPVSYQFNDNDPIDGISYYRLKEVDRDGSSSYSRTLTIQYEAKSLTRKIINPFSSSVFIQFTAGLVPAGTAWKLYDMQGRMVLTRRTSGNTINEPAATLKPGMYLLEIMVRGKKQVIKLVKSS